ncbi:MAG: PAS domain S-box protein [Thermodesulfobacteriota bacterium]
MAKDTNRVISELHKGKYIPTQNMKRKKTNTHLDDQRMIRSLKNPAVTKPFPAEQAKSAKEEITALKQEMEFILGVTKTGLDIIDPQFNIRYIDPEWAKVYGDPTEKKCYEYFMDRNEVCPDCGIPVALKKKRVAVTEETLVKEGNRPIQVTTIPFQDGDGEWLVAEVNVDISERKRTEESLRKAHEELEIRVQERTAELARTNEAMQAEITERKPIEDALRESEERYRSFVENFQGIAYRGRMDFVPIFFHGAVEAITGYKEEEFLAGNPRWDQMIHPDDLSKIHESFQEIHSTPSYSAAREYRILRKDGKVQWVHEQIQNICDSSGKPMMVQGALYDITDRKRAEEALRRSEERYRTILEEMEEGYFETDLAGNLTFVNDAGCRNLGYPREELIGMNNRMYADEENAKKVFQALSKLYRTGEPCRVFDYETIKKDGTKAISELSASLMRDSEGKPIGFRGTSHHVTERKQMEEALREGEERYRTLLETMEEGYYEVDLTGNLTFINDSFSKMHARENMLGMNNRQYMSKEMARRVYEMFNGVYKTGQPVRLVEWEIIKGNGGKAVVEASVYLIKNAKGERIGFRGIERDITDRKRAEEALLNAAQQWRTTFDGISDIVCLLDKEGRIIKCNKAMTDLLGKPFGEIINRTHFEIVHGAPMPIEECPVERLWKTHRRETDSLLINDRWFSIAVDPLLDKAGRLVGAVHIMSDVTERKRAEEAIREAEKRYRQVIENAVDIIYTTDANGNFTYANSAAMTTTGYSLEELQRFNYLNLILPEHRDRVSKIYISQFRQRQVTTYVEFPFFNKSGEVLWFGQNASLVIEGENPVGFHVIARDITERKKAEEALSRSEEKYRTILESIEDGYYEVDLAGIFTFLNDSMCRIWGYPKEELMGMNNRQYTDPETAKKVFQAYNRVYRTGEPGRLFDYEIIRKDGAKRYVEVSISLQKDLSGKPAGFSGIIRDITEHKQADETLRRSEEKYRTIIEKIQDGYFENDLAGNFTFVNDVICRHLGYARDELIGMNYQQYTDEENGRNLYQHYIGLYRTGQPIEPFEAGYVTKDGAKLLAEISVSLIWDSEGKPIGFRGISRDITERKRAEEEKLSLQEQLRQSQKMEAIGQLAGGVAHDFNNLLTVIKGYSQLSLLDLKENDSLRGNIQEIEKATQRATDLTRQLLAFSRRQILDLKVLDLNVLLTDLDKMLRRIIGEDIQLVTLLSEDLGKVKIDPSQIEQVIFNLAVNARDAMPSGGKLTIETANVELDEEYAHAHISVISGHYVRLSVSDTGVGMSQEVKERVFEPFFTTKEKGKGTGLGLSMVYGIVKQSSGNIWVYSEPEHGTTFKIYLPRTEEEVDTLHEREEKDFFPRGSETVLLVEDDELVRDLANRLLKQQGYRVLDAANGEEALRVAKEHDRETIHLLLADIVMPQMGGKALADQLKILRPNVKVLYTSGYADNAIFHHGVLDPGTHFLQKPFSLKTLSHKVREVLDG